MDIKDLKYDKDTVQKGIDEAMDLEKQSAYGVNEMDKITMTEEQAMKIYDDTILSECRTSKQVFLAGLKDCGYIKQTPVEEIEEIYNKLKHRGQMDKNHDKLYEAIQYLKKQIEKNT